MRGEGSGGLPAGVCGPCGALGPVTPTTNAAPNSVMKAVSRDIDEGFNRNLLFRHRFHGSVSLLRQIARPKERLPRKSQRLRKKSRAIRCRPCLARLIENPPSQLRRHLSILLCPP